jgi:hypothetical protein
MGTLGAGIEPTVYLVFLLCALMLIAVRAVAGYVHNGKKMYQTRAHNPKVN